MDQAFTDQGDHITNIFGRSLVHNGYVLEFAKGNSLLLARVPFVFNPTRVGSDQELFYGAVQTARKGAIRHVEDY